MALWGAVPRSSRGQTAARTPSAVQAGRPGSREGRPREELGNAAAGGSTQPRHLQWPARATPGTLAQAIGDLSHPCLDVESQRLQERGAAIKGGWSGVWWL